MIIITLSLTVNDIYAADPASAATLPYASVYTTPTTGTPTYSSESPLYMQQNITTPYQTIYPVIHVLSPVCKSWIRTHYQKITRSCYGLLDGAPFIPNKLDHFRIFQVCLTFQNGLLLSTFSWFRLYSRKIAIGWIWSQAFWNRMQPHCQVCHFQTCPVGNLINILRS